MRQNLPAKEQNSYALVGLNIKVYVRDLDPDADDEEILAEAFSSITSDYLYCKRFMTIHYTDTEEDSGEIEIESED